MGGMGFTGMGIGWILWVAILIAVIVFAVRSLSPNSSSNGAGSERETPMEILKKRYARGEISEEEFHRMEHELGH